MDERKWEGVPREILVRMVVALLARESELLMELKGLVNMVERTMPMPPDVNTPIHMTLPVTIEEMSRILLRARTVISRIEEAR